MKIELHKADLPSDVKLGNLVAVDTEAMGLRHHRDRLCLVQLSSGDGVCHLVQIDRQDPLKAKNLMALLANPSVTKIFHFARFDVAALYKTFGIVTAPLYCTKIASKLVRTYADRHGLKDICKELLGIEISKQEQLSDWGSEVLRDHQLQYAATDVLHLHKLKEKFDALLAREGRSEMARACFEFIPYRALLDLDAGEDFDIFQH